VITPVERRLQRRLFLKAIGLGLAAPLAASMSRLALAQPDGLRPTRFLVVYLPHGMPAEHFDPPGSGTNFSLSDGGGQRILAPLQPFIDRTILLRGMDITGHNNHPSIRAVLNGDADRSVEQVVASALGTQAVTLGAVTVPSYGFTSDSWLFRDGSWINPQASPVVAADSLFGVPDPGPGGGSDASFRAAALQLTLGEVDAMHAALAGLTRERNKLGVHLQAVQALKAKKGGVAPIPVNFTPSCVQSPVLPTVDAIRALDVGKSWFYDEVNLPTIYDGHLEVIAQALTCGAARVMGLQAMYANAQINMGFAGVDKDHHDPVSHSSGPTGRDEFAQVQRWFVQRLVDKVIAPLDTPDPLDTGDPTRTVLDNTLIYFCSEVADGNEHNSNKSTIWVTGSAMTAYVPMFMVGGGGGCLNTGRIIDFNNRPHADALVTACHAMGVMVSGFGPHSTGPIVEALS
jgi:hypothetical protein